MAACNGIPPWSTKAFVHTFWAIEHHDVVSSGIFKYEFCDNRPQEWTKKAWNIIEEAAEAYMVEVIADSHFQK